VYDQAVAKGETAGLLEQAPESSDIFSTKLGNVPAGQSVIVEITYIGELKHHETEGIRFTIPTKIAPRYGPATSYDASMANSARDVSGIKITVDVHMPDGTFIKGVQSPSHPIAVSMGTVSTSSNSDPVMSKASATLALGSASLDMDFVLIVLSKDTGSPKALLETHATIPNQRALMVTLVPKFSLPASRPEIVFVADRSGSMSSNIPMLKSAMNVFLKSMPTGVKFNICSFGSSYSFLWTKSQSYTKETLTQATNHVQTFSANLGGTETFAAIRATIESRYGDIPLEIILLTDGDITRQNELFVYVNRHVQETNGKIRVFPLGIGNGVSHALIEGLARAGNGFAQAVQNGERLDNSVVRMLRGALSPHITDYTLEVKYEQEDEGEEQIDFVTEGMKVLLSDDERSIRSEKSLRSEKPSRPIPATISLFDTSVDPDKTDIKGMEDSKFWLPHIPHPKLLQAPHNIPSLFAFSRTTVYLIMSPDTVQRKPVSVTLRATSAHGPLALEIPVEILASKAETIHQLAAKKAVQDLEEGRGWIYEAKDQNGTMIKERYPSRFQELVEQEAVRLGEKFQIAGKWCSFVAVAANDKEIAAKKAERRRSSKHALDNRKWSSGSRIFCTDLLPDDEYIEDEEEDDDDECDEEEDCVDSGMDQSEATMDDEDDGFMVVGVPEVRKSNRRGMSGATKHKKSRTGLGDVTTPQGPATQQGLQDFQMQLMLLEQQNKKRSLMSRQEQTSHSSPGQNVSIQPQTTSNYSFGQSISSSISTPQLGGQQQQQEQAHSNFDSLSFSSQHGSADVLQDFDFDSFLHSESGGPSPPTYSPQASLLHSPATGPVSQPTGFQSMNAGMQNSYQMQATGYQPAQSPFSAPSQAYGLPSATLFGATPQSNASNTAFGASAPTSGGLFGASPHQSSGGLFGSVQKIPQNNKSSASSSVPTGGLFGAAKPQSQKYSGVPFGIGPSDTGSGLPSGRGPSRPESQMSATFIPPASNPSASSSPEPTMFGAFGYAPKAPPPPPPKRRSGSEKVGLQGIATDRRTNTDEEEKPRPGAFAMGTFGVPGGANAKPNVSPFALFKTSSTTMAPNNPFRQPISNAIMPPAPSPLPEAYGFGLAHALQSRKSSGSDSDWDEAPSTIAQPLAMKGRSASRSGAGLPPPPPPPPTTFPALTPHMKPKPFNTTTPTKPLTMTLVDRVLALINLQDFGGFWAAEKAGEIVSIFGFDFESGDGEGGRGGVRWITLLVVCWLEERAAEEEGTWGLVVEKARAWLDSLAEVAGDGGLVSLERKARNEVRRH
jgi:hypothetical protein